MIAALGVLPCCAFRDVIVDTFRYVGELVQGDGEVTEEGMQQGDWSFKDEDGNLRAEGRYEDDVQVGVWTYYFANGNKEYEGEMVDQRREGPFRFWYEDGTLRAKGDFVRGREFGEWTFWHPNGEVSRRGALANGLQEGTWTSFRPDGTVASRGRFLDGQPVGRWEHFGAGGEASPAVSWTPLPEGMEWASDHWEDGTLRREGFLRNGRQEGLWRMYHRSGAPRLIGEFRDGSPNGNWFALDGDGELVAAGKVELGRPVGSWRLGVDRRVSDASSFGPPMPFSGSWSRADDLDERATDLALGLWLAEIRAPLPEGSIADDSGPTAEDEEAPESVVEVATEEADVPVKAQVFTRSEQDLFNRLKDWYTDAREARKSGGIYAGSRRKGAASISEADTLGGDQEAAKAYIGKPLPLMVYKNDQGVEVDLAEFRGQRVVLVILRGYPGKVCIYCTAQTAALYEAGAVDAFARLGARLEVLFPGQKNGLSAFQEAVRRLSDADFPEYGMLYENDYIVGPMLRIEGSKVIPTTFILDEEGIVRFAYVAKSPQDRPSVELLKSELRKLNGSN